ncbi:hypothetical protein CERZMDRAFT_89595 [Cercospora zeae-maydis SCOH1-5]|uniref:Uncharacterized protein n=1 Tax=Cercospora zeae-maydis SCOH1-5 TaxID=717836 RepID=A0A6A6FWD0_9PEZI|nr:hypothetical protein CERZMDRAFT_89595 [Cercospora zeae-maydis SCOH1-5]
MLRKSLSPNHGNSNAADGPEYDKCREPIGYKPSYSMFPAEGGHWHGPEHATRLSSLDALRREISSRSLFSTRVSGLSLPEGNISAEITASLTR